MSTSASPHSEHGAGARKAQRALILFFALVAAAIAVLFLFVQGRDDTASADLRLLSWRPTEAEVAAQAQRDRERSAALPWGADEDRVADALAAYNLVEAKALGDPLSPQLREAQAELRRILQRYAGEHGVERYHALGLRLRERFLMALDAVLAGARKTGERPLIYVERRPLSPEVEEWRRWAGAFLDQALRAGLVEADGSVAEGAAHVPGLFFLVRWFHWIHPITDYTFQLSDWELFSFWAWKAEQSEGPRIERRLELLDQILRIRPSYPAGRVRGVLYALEDRWEEAATAWTDWLTEHPDDDVARENLRFAREVLASRRDLSKR